MKIGDFEFSIEELENVWYTEKGLLLLSAILFFSGFYLGQNIFTDPNDRLLPSLLISALLMLIGYLFWLHSRRFPKVQKNKIGIIIAIRDNTPEATKIKKDIIDKFQEITENLPIKKRICIVPVNDFIAEQTKNNIDADKTLDKCGGHFIIFGRALGYKTNENYQYEFDLTFKVRHRLLNIQQKSLIQEHFQESILSKQWLFLEENPFTVIRATANNIREITLYVIGMAAFFSFDFKTSLNFHKTVYSLLKENQQKKDDFNVIYRRLKSYIADAKILRGLQISQLHKNNLSKQKIALKMNEEALNLFPNHYSALVNKAKYLFQIGNIDEAKKTIKRIKRINNKHPYLISDSSWRYSEAFLLFYEKNIDRGKSAYRKALSGHVTDFVLIGLVDFLEDYVSKNPDEIQFHYPLGMIYYHKLNNITMALKEFEIFLDKTKEKPEYINLKSEVLNYKNSIEKQINQIS